MNSLNRKVPIKNVLYMYSYIWDEVNYFDFSKLSCDDDFDAINILSELFIINMHNIIKRGFYKEYVENEDELKAIRGKIMIKESIRNMQLKKNSLVCKYDDYSENNLLNQIMKTTASKLYRTSGINKENKKRIKNIILYFNRVNMIEIDKHTFDIKYNKNNKYLIGIMRICQLINNSLMLSENIGDYKFINVLDDDDTMNYVYEKFIYKFYEYHLQREQKTFEVAFQKQLKWNVKDGRKELLPIMKMDTLIVNDHKKIIIDTKYKNSLATNSWGTEKFISGNLYQMYTYMNTIDFDGELEGMLLYPKAEESIDETYSIEVTTSNGTKEAKLRIKTVDLSVDWKIIEKELLEMVE